MLLWYCRCGCWPTGSRRPHFARSRCEISFCQARKEYPISYDLLMIWTLRLALVVRCNGSNAELASGGSFQHCLKTGACQTAEPTPACKLSEPRCIPAMMIIEYLATFGASNLWGLAVPKSGLPPNPVNRELDGSLAPQVSNSPKPIPDPTAMCA